MVEQQFEIIIRSTAEVRDADGNLVSSSPAEARLTVTETELEKLVKENQT